MSDERDVEIYVDDDAELPAAFCLICHW